MSKPAGRTESGSNSHQRRPIALAWTLLSPSAMSIATVVDRVRADFMEMPGLELTLRQAVRLWTVGMDDCRFVIDALVDSGFLKWTARQTIVRTGAAFRAWPEPTLEDIPVRLIRQGHRSVGRG